MTVDVDATAAVVAVLFVAALVRSTFGFGDAVLAMPLLSLLVGVETATPVVGLVAVANALLVVGIDRDAIDVATARLLVLATLPGIPVGLLLLTRAPEGVVRGVLGLGLVAFGAWSLRRPALHHLSRRWALPVGFVAGCLGGAYNTNGPPVVVYASLRDWSPEQFRATLQGYFLCTGLLITAGQAASGLWTTAVWQLFLLAAPGVVVALVLGGRLRRRIPAGRFERWVFAAIIVLGLALLV